MLSIQEIFNEVIDAGFYSENYKANEYCSFMCFSLKYAEADGIITKQEMEFALLQIRNYVKNEQCTLVDELKELFKREVTFKDTLDIYKNWEKRPDLVVN